MNSLTKTVCRFNSSIPKLATTPNKYNARSSAFNLKPQLPNGLFFHPAPASLDPEITPKAFLPESDPRKDSPHYFKQHDSLLAKENIPFMPSVSKISQPKNYNLSPETVKQIQELRDAGVSRKEIKQKFNVTDNFISLTTTSNSKTISKQVKLLKKTASKWSNKTKAAKKAKELKKIQWEYDF
ncbi:hypothetical protein CANINC_004570 [Pichia inconspicua]|uniref:Uncharacterized protein n=1 Tax=Pichia inconspicua TaxID=52247 RepID=A0A4T0WW43_9ASCO|nr:hypothetical protein CANINC_004570 [[Candida] inconspicua]